MKKHLVYLTKSAEVAERIARSYTVGEDGIKRVAYGSANSHIIVIPEIYLDEGYFYCAVTYSEDACVDPYRLVIA